MSHDQELQVLRDLRERAEILLRSEDPLMASQYRHLYGRITALIAQKCNDTEARDERLA